MVTLPPAGVSFRYDASQSLSISILIVHGFSHPITWIEKIKVGPEKKRPEIKC